MRHFIFYAFLLLPYMQLTSQTLAQHVIASSGSHFSNNTGSISFTIGETVTSTMNGGGYKLTQGFHQPFEMHLNLKAFLQGYYDSGSGQMNDVLYNEGQYNSNSNVADTITIELHHATSPYNTAYSTQTLLHQNGLASIKGYGNIGQPYYIVVKHRNHVETWSSVPVTLNTNTSYNFSTSDSKAFGNNQIEVQNGVYALFSGDINQDGAVDAFDYVLLDPDIYNGVSGYLSTDLNGDGSVDIFDYVILDPNVYNGIGFSTP